MHLGNLRRILRFREKKRVICIVACVLAITVLILFVGLRASAAPIALPVFHSVAQSRVQSLVREVAAKLVREGNYDDFCTLSYSSDGSIRGVWVDSESANRFVSDLTSALDSELAKIPLSYKIRSGDILFPKLFSGSGIPLTLRGSLYGGASARLVSSLDEGGLNQTLHRMEVEVTIPLTLTVLGEEEQFTVTSHILLGEAVIVGALPGGVVIGG